MLDRSARSTPSGGHNRQQLYMVAWSRLPSLARCWPSLASWHTADAEERDWAFGFPHGEEREKISIVWSIRYENASKYREVVVVH
jgi:hypothetical protein